ncbi:hypothetical protein HD598_002233 [Neomicrococcus aestuarii]|uniref:Uncharacterized protein n=1 Tax=Neomicrococcus aestuarii TaxID=556325 RepID=A0A7W8WZM4_9MICC|nr:hypothetical protein [Neomicrococcus aestuarii]
MASLLLGWSGSVARVAALNQYDDAAPGQLVSRGALNPAGIWFSSERAWRVGIQKELGPTAEAVEPSS